jgi:dipeptidyl aminopeptidase/acylaminoacyl peptidase
VDVRALLLALMAAVPPAQPPSTPCALQVQHERDVRYGERPYAATLRFAPVTGHRNEAPGPDSLILVSRTTHGFYPRVYLENRRDGSSRCLEPRGWSEIPSWAPNGRWFAYVHKDTVTNVERLVVGCPRRPHAAIFERTVDIVDYWWSPDSRAIALYGRDRATRAEALFVYWPESKQVWRADQLEYFLDYDVSWAPNSRLLAFSRPEGANKTDDIIRADIMLADVRKRCICRLLRTPDRVELEPQWISDSALRCTVVPARGQMLGTPRDIVMEIKASPQSSR